MAPANDNACRTLRPYHLSQAADLDPPHAGEAEVRDLERLTIRVLAAYCLAVACAVLYALHQVLA